MSALTSSLEQFINYELNKLYIMYIFINVYIYNRLYKTSKKHLKIITISKNFKFIFCRGNILSDTELLRLSSKI